MGYPMALNLRKAIGQFVTVVIADVNNSTCERLRDEATTYGPVRVVDTAYEAVQIALVLPNAEAINEVYIDKEKGALAGASKRSDRQKKLFIECGTISQIIVLDVSERSKAISRVYFVDAPISGSPQASQQGTLTFMVGCPKELFQEIGDVLVHMGKEDGIIHCGDVASGIAFKTINNYISLISVVAVSEAYNIANRLGLNLSILTNIFNNSSAQCSVTSKKNPLPRIQPNVAASRDYNGVFRIELAQKDLSLAVQLAKSAGARTVLNKAALLVFDEVAANPQYAGKDARVVYKYLSRNK